MKSSTCATCDCPGVNERRERLSTTLLGLWAGMVWSVGALAAPTLFELLPRGQAGLVAGHLFALESYLSMAAALLVLMLQGWQERWTLRAWATPQARLLAGVLALTLAAQYGLRPWMDVAKANAEMSTFFVLHTVSAALFLIKGLMLVALLWRAPGERSEPMASRLATASAPRH